MINHPFDEPKALAKAMSHLGGVVSEKKMVELFKAERERNLKAARRR